MRCYACDNPGTVHDGDCNRYYCNSCWTAIWVAIGDKGDDDLTIPHSYGTIDYDQLERETGIYVYKDTQDMS